MPIYTPIPTLLQRQSKPSCSPKSFVNGVFFSLLFFASFIHNKLEPNGCDSWVQISRRSFGNHTKGRHANELRPKLKIKIKLFSVKLYEKVKERPETMDLRRRWPQLKFVYKYQMQLWFDYHSKHGPRRNKYPSQKPFINFAKWLSR